MFPTRESIIKLGVDVIIFRAESNNPVLLKSRMQSLKITRRGFIEQL